MRTRAIPFRHFLTGIALCVLISACSKIPNIPSLSLPTTNKIVSGEHLSAYDIRKIYTALNQNGDLNDLKPLFETPTDESLNAIAGLLDRHLYQTALDPDGLPALLETRIEKQDFSRFREYSTKLIEEEKYTAKADTLLYLATWNRFPELASHDVGLLSAPAAEIFERIEADKSYAEIHEWEQFAAPSTEQIYADLERFLSDRRLTESLVQLGNEMQDSHFGTHALRALSLIRSKFQHAEKGPIAFEGLGYGLRKLLLSEPGNPDALRYNQLDLLLYLGLQANRGTNGLFNAIAGAIDEQPDIFFTFSKQWASPIIVKSVHRALQRSLHEKDLWYGLTHTQPPPTQTLTERVFSGIAKIRGFDDSFVSVDPFPSAFRSQIPAYVLSIWIQQVLKENAKEFYDLSERWEDSDIWTLAVKPSKLRVEFVETDATGKMSFPHHDRMLASGLDPDTVERFEKYIREGFIADLYYEIDTDGAPFATVLRQAVDQVHETLPIGEGGAFLNAAAAYIASPENNILTSFETDNIFDSVHRHLAGTSLGAVRRLRDLIFDKLEIGITPWEGANGLGNTLSPFVKNDPKHMELLKSLVVSSQPFVAFDTPAAKNLPTPFESYLVLVQSLPPVCEAQCPIHTLGEIFSFLSRAQFLSLYGVGRSGFIPVYPGLFRLVEQGKPLAKVLHGLSLIDGSISANLYSEQETLLKVLTQAFGRVGNNPESGLSLHIDLLRLLWAERPQGALAWIESFLSSSSWSFLRLENFPAGERDWLQYMVKSGDHAVLWKFLTLHFDRKKSLRLVNTLLDLETKGSLGQVFLLMDHLEDERMQKLARILMKWQSSGELRSFLLSLQTLLKPLVP